MPDFNNGQFNRFETSTSPASTDLILTSDGDKLEKVTVDDIKNTAIEQTIQINSGARIGSTAGWVITGDNAFLGTCPASQTASTLAVSVTGLPLNASIISFSVRGQIESAGNQVTLDAEMFKVTAVASGSTSSSIGAITQVDVTADTLVGSSKTVTGTNTVSNNISYYVLIMATTGASCDIELNSITVTFTGV